MALSIPFSLFINFPISRTPTFYFSLAALIFAIVGSLYLFIEWLHYRRRHRFLIFWSIGLAFLYIFQIPEIAANAGSQFTVSNFNSFFSLTLPLKLLGHLLIYLGILSVISPLTYQKKYKYLFAWFASALTFYAFYFQNDLIFLSRLPLYASILLFYWPLYLLMLHALWKWYRKQDLIKTGFARVGIFLMGVSAVIGIYGSSLILQNITSYPPAFWFVAFSSHQIFIMQIAEILILLFGFIFVHRNCFRKLDETPGNKQPENAGKGPLRGLSSAIKNNGYTVGVFLALLLFLVFMSFGDKVSVGLTKKLMSKETVVIEQAITDELEYSLQQSKEIVESGVLNPYIEVNDAENVLSISNNEKWERNLGFLTVVNKDGVALSNLPFIDIRGDYAGLTTTWGRSAAQGKETAMIGVGKNFPIIFASAYPIIKDAKIEGAIHSGFLLDDEYTVKFKEKYFKNGFQIAFYSKQEGVIGDSFQNESIKKLISTAFNEGSEWLKNGRSDEFISINNTDYFLKNIVFPDAENSQENIGGVLIFLPHSTLYQKIILCLLVILLLLPLVVYTLKRLPTRNIKQKNQMLAVITVIALFIGAGTFYINQLKIEEAITPIQEPSYTIYNATLKFEPDGNIIGLDSKQRINIRLDTGGEAINTVQAIVNYDSSIVKVEEIITTNSLCAPEFFLEKEINNKLGEVRITCALPSPGLTGNRGAVAELVIQPLRTGDLTLSFKEGTKVLANDGLGTNVLRIATNANYQVAPSKFLLTGVNKVSFPQINLFSSTHPNSERWYNKKDIRIFWPVYKGYSYIYLFNKTPDTILGDGQTLTDNSIALRVDSDGINYFHIAPYKDGKIGLTSHLKFKIDATPPIPPTIKTSGTKVRLNDVVRFEFSGEDETSGLQPAYFIKIDKGTHLPSLHQLYIGFPEKGSHTLSVRVFDNADNFTDSEVEIEVE